MTDKSGSLGELKFDLDAYKNGLLVSLPLNVCKYDRLVDNSKSVYKVQIKTIYNDYKIKNRYKFFILGNLKKYNSENIDFISCYIVHQDVWYIIPISEIVGRKSIRFSNKLQHNSKSYFACKYLNRWDLFCVKDYHERSSVEESGCGL